ncbi:hypothetical protein [Agrobacterium cavarae]
MAVTLSLLGIVLFLIMKRFMFQRDEGKALYAGLLEMPVDANLIGFMLSIATISQLKEPNHFASATILSSTILMCLSIIIWKYVCSLMSDRDGDVYFANPKLILGLTILNIILACSAIYLPIEVLGANP